MMSHFLFPLWPIWVGFASLLSRDDEPGLLPPPLRRKEEDESQLELFPFHQNNLHFSSAPRTLVNYATFP